MAEQNITILGAKYSPSSARRGEAGDCYWRLGYARRGQYSLYSDAGAAYSW